ncbi:MAG TPA: hypothetical protein ACQGQU_09390, partial [Xylella fastidiosa subsp. multiplex]
MLDVVSSASLSLSLSERKRMKNRFAMMLMALLPVLVACQAKDGSADTVQSAVPAPSAPLSSS